MNKLAIGLVVLASGAFNAATANEVELLKSASHFGSKYGYNWQSNTFNIKVDNLGFEKNVAIYYRNAEGEWVEQAATYAGPINDSSELWKAAFTINLNGPHEFNDPLDLEYAVKYQVNGETFWDSNSSQNYQLAANSGEFITGPVYSEYSLAKAPYEYTYGDNTGTVKGDFQVSVLLQNFGFEKEVKVHFSYDNWATKHVKNAAFVPARYTPGYSYVTYPNGNNVENWYLRTDGEEAQNIEATQVEYAIEYVVDGKTYWDNNFGQNYTVEIEKR